MADFTYEVFFNGPLADPIALAQLWHYKILEKYIKAADQTYQGSQADVPVGETGDLQTSGQVGNLIENGPGEFSIDVSYGDGSSTGTYDYAEGAATTQYSAGAMAADGYSWFVELGHMSVAGNPVPAQPFLGPNFDINVDGLLQIGLPNLLDKA